MSELYLWGKPITPHASSVSQQHGPIVSLNCYVEIIACGENHCIIAGQQGVFGLGDNSEGQLGLGQKKNSGSISLKIELKFRQKIVQASCGWYHTLLLDQLGRVFSSGRGDNGQLGRGKVRNSSTFECVLHGAIRISAGKDHSLALCGHKAMGWGNSKEGQLGMPIKKNYYYPQELNVYPCDFILAGQKYSIFSTKKGIYGTGVNNNYQLGLGHDGSVYVPKKITIQDEIVYMTGGKYIVAGTEKKEWYMWGSGILGVFKYPTKMTFLKGADYVTMGHQFALFVREGRIWIWGYSHWGQLNINNEVIEYPTESLFFSSLNLDGFVCGHNILMGYKNTSSYTNNAWNQTKLTWSNSIKEQQYKYDELRKQKHSDSERRENSFDKYYGFNKTDQIREINRQHASQNNSNDGYSSRRESAELSGSWPVSRDLASQQINKKYVKLINPIKTLTTNKTEIFQKQNKQLRNKLEYDRKEKQKLFKLHMRNMNSFADDRITSKMNKLSNLGTTKSNQMQSLNPLSEDYPQPQPISFRPWNSDKIEAMGAKIESLKNQLSDLCD